MTNQIFQNHTVIRVLESEDLHVRQVKSAPKYAAEQTNMNRISIDHLTEAELIDLNHRIVQRLRLISQVHAHKAMLEFRIGDRVTFEPQGGNPLFGILTRYNKKSVTVVTDDGHRWNVSPSFLRRAELGHETATGQEDAHPSALIPFRQK